MTLGAAIIALTLSATMAIFGHVMERRHKAAICDLNARVSKHRSDVLREIQKSMLVRARVSDLEKHVGMDAACRNTRGLPTWFGEYWLPDAEDIEETAEAQTTGNRSATVPATRKPRLPSRQQVYETKPPRT